MATGAGDAVAAGVDPDGVTSFWSLEPHAAVTATRATPAMNRASPRGARQAGWIVKSGVMQETAPNNYRGSGQRTTGHHCQTQETGRRTPAASGIRTCGHLSGNRRRRLN
ncbi:MAG TPA: hypothetical protein VJ820_19220 [Propionibacteriaceae bacterium]|nr:hypothetical protein [Propionibacteriaceae bacterium]